MPDRRVGVTRSAAAILAVVLALGLVVAVPGTVTAESSVVDLECTAGDGGGPVYVADSGLGVVDNDSAPDEAYPSFPDNETVHLGDDGYPNVTFSAGGDAELRLENRTTERLCLAAVDATDHEILIDPANLSAVTVNGSANGLAFGSLDFDVDDVPEMVYNASDTIALTIHDTGLDEGDSIAIESLGSDAIDVELDAGSNGTLSVELPAGDHRLTLSTASSGGGLPGLPPPPPDDEPATFELSELAVEPTEIEVGEQIAVSAMVTNVGDETGSHAVELLVDGEVVAEESVYLSGGSSEAVAFDTVLHDAGTATISLGEESVGSVTVTDGEPGSDDDSGGTDPGSTDDGQATPDPESDADEEGGTPWHLITIGLVAIAAAGVGVAYSLGYLDPYLLD